MFQAPMAVTVGSQVLVELDFGPNFFHLECKGRVCWSETQPAGQTRFGVRFLDLLEEERLVLADLFGHHENTLQVVTA